jgi:hypothetical protein
VLLAITGVLLVVPSRRAIVYLLLLVVAFELSLGLDGYTYRVLFDHVPVFRGLRAMARVGVFVLMFVALLAAYGYRLLVAALSPAARRAVLGVVALMLLTEYHVTLTFVPYPNSAPEVYRVLQAQPRGVVLEVPPPRANALPGDDARYAYLSVFYWFPIVNGYSGFYPSSYIARLERLRNFPDDASIRQIRADNVKYVIVHASGYSESDLSHITARLRAIGMAELGTYSDGIASAAIFRSQ